jgi:single-strand DNA-binding protein
MPVNKAILIGNVGKDPEIRSMSNGKQVASFSLATSENWKDKNTGEKKSKSEWHNIIIFSEGLVKVCQSYVKKGSKLYIEGAIQTSKWTDNNGNDKYTTEVVLQGFNARLLLLDGKGESKPSSTPYKDNQGSTFVREELDDEIPPF